MKFNRVFFFNITYKCNNSCTECVSKYTREHSSRVVDLEEFKKFNTKFNFSYSDRIVISGGEPTLHNEFEKIIEYLSLFSTHIIVYTNGRTLGTISSNILGKIERLIIPFYGNELCHNNYTRNNRSYIETVNSIKNKLELSEKIEIKLIVQNIENLMFFLSDKDFNTLIRFSSKTISVAGFIDYSSKKSILQKEIFKPLEEFVKKLLSIGKVVKIYDIPLCKFSSDMIEYIDNTFNEELSISFKKKICCSATGEHKEVSYNSIPDYYSNCIECELNMICTMVLKRYNVLCISNNYSYLDTE